MFKIKLGKWQLVIGLIVILLISWIGYRWYNRDVVKVKLAKIVRGPLEQVVSASGIVDAPVYELGPKLGGKIMKIFVREGQWLRGGETLAEFDDTTRIVAPARGVVAKIDVDEGETAVPGRAAITIVNYARCWVEAQIDEIDIGNIRIGDRAKITTDVYPDKVFEGEIYWIAPLAELRQVGGRVKIDEESYVFPVKIKFLGPHDELKVNMSVNVEVVTKRNVNALVVPREALVNKDDVASVFIRKWRRVRQQEIKIGIRSYTSVEALAGLKEGDEVAITNVAKLKDWGRITIEQ
jgi:multidrug efflux pump subunit AcrA (membrane-fusion protein)